MKTKFCAREMISSNHAPDDAVNPLLKACRELGVLSAEEPEISALQGDASDRRFFRIRQGAISLIGLISPRKNRFGLDENDSYFFIGKHLARHNLPVPRILWADPQRGHFLLQDLGDCHLQRLVRRRGNIGQLYRRAVTLLVKLHRLVPQGFKREFCFDGDTYTPSFVYRRELEYFRNSFLNDYMHLGVAEEDLRRDFENLAEAAGAQKTSQVMHRDFQSRNVMVCRRGLWIIDFQGMRFGPPAYDLAALLLDPYVHMPKRLQKVLLSYYWSAAHRFMGCTYSEFLASYHAVRLCRNLQVLAAYGFLSVTKGKSQFLQYIPRAWQQLLEWWHSSLADRYPKLKKCIAEIRRSNRMLLSRYL